MTTFKEVSEKLKASGKFESVEIYETVEETIQRLKLFYPDVSYEKLAESMGADEGPFTFIVVDSKRERCNIYSESDVYTLEDLLARGEGFAAF